MAQRTAQVIINVDSKSLQTLRTEIKELETSMSKIAIGTAEWNAQNQKLGTLKTTLQGATLQAKELQGQIQKISFDQQIKSVAKLGAGMVGAFSAVSGSLRLIGADSKVFDEMTAKAATLMSIMMGLNQFAETFSKTTIGGLKASFTGLVKTVQTASLAMKAALIGTGIGALVVAIGLLIANWQKLTNLFNGSAKEARKLVEQTKIASELTSEQVKSEKIIVEQQYLLNEGKGKEVALSEKNLALSKLNTKELQAQVKEQEALVAQLQLEYEQQTVILGIFGKKKKEQKAVALEQAKAVLDTKKTEEEISKLEEARAEQNVIISKKVQEQTVTLNKLENQLKIINATQYSTQQSYEKQQEILQQQLKVIDAQRDKQGKLTFELEQQRLSILSQVEANKRNNDYAQERLDIEIKSLKFQIDYARLTNEFYKQLDFAYRNQVKINQETEDKLRLEEKNIELINLINDGYQEAKKIQEELVNFDYRRNRIISERLVRLSEEVSISKELHDSLVAYLNTNKDLSIALNDEEKILVTNMEELAGVVDVVSKHYNDILTNAIQSDNQVVTIFERMSKNGERIVDNATSELTVRRLLAEVAIDSLQKQNDTLLDQKDAIEKIIKGYEQIQEGLKIERSNIQGLTEKEIERLNILKTQGKISKADKEEYVALLQKQQEFENKQYEITKKQLDVDASIADEQRNQVVLTQQIEDNTTKIEQTNADVLNLESRITSELKEQFKSINLLKSAVEKYDEEIRVTTDIIKQSMEFIAVTQEETAKSQQIIIDNAVKAQEQLIEGVQIYKDELDSLNEAEKDANGDRFDEIQARKQALQEEIAMKRKDWQDQENARVQAVNAKNKAEERAAKWRKAQSLVDAIVNTALAVIKALPNLFLSIATGVLGGIQIATIGAQKVPPAEVESPQQVPFKKGGFTGEGEETQIAGVVHKNEYVVPAKVVKLPQAQSHIEALEKQRLRGYQEGGFVAPVNVNGYDTSIDYVKFAGILATAISELPNPQVALVSVSNGLRDVELTKQNAGMNR